MTKKNLHLKSDDEYSSEQVTKKFTRQENAPVLEEKTSINHKPKVHILKKISRFIWVLHRKLFVSILISLAFFLSVLRLSSFYLETNPHIVQNFIESQLHTKVTFDSLQVDVQLLFPSVSLNHFVIKNKNNDGILFKFSSATIRVNTVLSLLDSQIKVDRLILEGASIKIKRTLDNQLSISEFELTKNNKLDKSQNIQEYLFLFDQNQLIVSNSELHFVDELHEYTPTFISAVNLKIDNKQLKHQVSLQAEIADSHSSIDLRFNFNGQLSDVKHWDGKIYGSLNNVNQQGLLHFLKQDKIQVENFQINRINMNTKFWTSIDKGVLQSIYGDIVIKNTDLSRTDRKQVIQLDEISTHFKLARNDDVDQEVSKKHASRESLDSQLQHNKNKTWVFDLFDLNLKINAQELSQKYLNFTFSTDNTDAHKIQFFLNNIELEDISPLVSFFSPYKLSQDVYHQLKVKGDINNIMGYIQLSSLNVPIKIAHYQVQAELEKFSINSFYSIPKIRNLSSHIILNETFGRAYIHSNDMSLHLNSFFREQWPIKQLSGELFWQREREARLFGARKLVLNNEHLNAKADVNFWLFNNGRTFMDLSGFYSDAKVKNVPYYLPAKVMSKGLVDWLDKAFLSGLGTDGGVVFRGEFSRFPYIDHSGALDIVFNTKNVKLNYNDGWPLLTDINALIQFTEQGMRVESTQSKLFSSHSNNIKVDIEYYLKSIVKLTGDINTHVADSVTFLKQSHLVSNDVLDILDAKGALDLNIDIRLPLKKGTPSSRVKVKLKNNTYYPPGFKRNEKLVNHIKGEVIVQNNRIDAEKLTANILGEKAIVSIKTEKQNRKIKQDPDISLAITTLASVEKLRESNLIPELLIPLSKQLIGKPKVKLTIKLPNTRRGLAFNLSSGLKNLQSDLPQPFNKQPKKLAPFKISYLELKDTLAIKEKNKKYAQLDIKVANVLSLALFLDVSKEQFQLLKGNIAFGGAKAKLPKDNLLRITGRLDLRPLEQWQALFVSDNTILSSPTQQLKSIVEQKLPDRKFTVPIELALQEIMLPELELDTKVAEEAKNKNLLASKSTMEPSSFPLINGAIHSLKLGTLNLGRFAIKSSRIDKDIVFDKLLLDGDLLSFSGKGKWHHWHKEPEINFEGVADIPSLEQLFIALGNEQLIRRGKSKISGYIKWQGGLSDYRNDNIEGRFTIAVVNGAWIEGKPGAIGRLLGLLNMNVLARRLSLDFSDVSDEGFEFDKIEGDLRIVDGVAYTQNFQVLSPSAKILLTGSSNLVSKQFNQRVIVIPEVSATLPLAGAAVAGPAGAAVVWVGQKILGEQINKATALDYTITGSWDEPIIKKDKTSEQALNNFRNVFRLDNKSLNEGANEPLENP